MQQLNQSFGSGGMSCAFDSNNLVEYFQYLKRIVNTSIPVKKAVMHTGLQENSKLWVLNASVHIDHLGNLLDPLKSDYVWLDKDLVIENDRICSSDISPHICLPLSTDPLVKLIDMMEVCMKHNFIPALFVIAGALMSFHYIYVVHLWGGCSMVIAKGESETGKSTAIRAALSLFGCENIGHFVKGTNAAFIERSTLSTLPYGIDDPCKGKSGKSKANQLDISELAVDLYNSARSANLKTGSIKPRSIPIVATNYDIEEEGRVCSRTILIPFSNPAIGSNMKDEIQVWNELEESIHRNIFSSAVGWIVSLGENLVRNGKTEVDTMRDEFSDGSSVTPRNVLGWSICIYFLKEVSMHKFVALKMSCKCICSFFPRLENSICMI